MSNHDTEYRWAKCSNCSRECGVPGKTLPAWCYVCKTATMNLVIPSEIEEQQQKKIEDDLLEQMRKSK